MYGRPVAKVLILGAIVAPNSFIRQAITYKVYNK